MLRDFRDLLRFVNANLTQDDGLWLSISISGEPLRNFPLKRRYITLCLIATAILREFEIVSCYFNGWMTTDKQFLETKCCPLGNYNKPIITQVKAAYM